MPVFDIYECPNLTIDYEEDRTRLEYLRRNIKFMSVEDMDDLLVEVEQAIVSIEHQLKSRESFKNRSIDWFNSAEAALNYKTIARNMLERRMKRLERWENYERLKQDREETYQVLASGEDIPGPIRQDLALVRTVRNVLPPVDYERLVAIARNNDPDGWVWDLELDVIEANDDHPGAMTHEKIVVNAD